MNNTFSLRADLRFRIRALLIFFIISLVLSGVTAFALEAELRWLCGFCRDEGSHLARWLLRSYAAVKQTNDLYPFLSYGTDWLAFAHIIIAIAFIGPLRNPFRNVWVIQFGIIACILVLPLALIAGHMRGIPFFWQLIDCSFGIIGIIPLWLSYRYIRRLECAQSF